MKLEIINQIKWSKQQMVGTDEVGGFYTESESN